MWLNGIKTQSFYIFQSFYSCPLTPLAPRGPTTLINVSFLLWSVQSLQKLTTCAHSINTHTEPHELTCTSQHV